MDGNEVRKAALLARIEAERGGWEALLAEVGEGRMERPGAAGDWTFKDVIGHLNGWRVRTLARLEAAQTGTEPVPPPWPGAYDDETDEGVEAINRWFYDLNAARSSADVVTESREQLRQLREAVEALPEADLFDPGRYVWMGGEPLAAVIEGSFGHLHEEHEPAIRAWLARTDAET